MAVPKSLIGKIVSIMDIPSTQFSPEKKGVEIYISEWFSSANPK